MDGTDIREIQSLLDDIRAELADLRQRVGRLEHNGTAAPVREPEPVVAPPQSEPIPEGTLAVIAATVAAFFGERVHVRQIRLVGSRAWAQQGRVSIQASHILH
jgi:methylmalonyl-CoA carboxyltransferase large subunit